MQFSTRGVYFHMFQLIIERDNIVIRLFYTVALTRFNLQGSTLRVCIDPIKKSFKQKLFRIKFSKKKSVRAYLYLPQEQSQGTRNICNALKFENLDSLKLHSSTPMEDRDMLSLTLFLENSILNNFWLKLFFDTINNYPQC